MKRVAILVSIIAFVIVFFSCSNEQEVTIPDNVEVSSYSGELSENAAVTADSVITLSNLEKDSLYGVISSNTSRSTSEENGNRGSSGLVNVGDGAFIHYSQNGDPLTFTGKDAGISGTGTIRTIKYEPEHSDMKIDTEEDNYLYIDWEGNRVYIEYYRINLNDYPDLDRSRIVVFPALTGGGFTASAGVIDEQTGYVRHTGIFDFSGRDYMSVLNQHRVDKLGGTTELFILNPVILKENEKIEISAPGTYEVSPSHDGKELVVEIELTQDYYSYYFQWGATNGRIAYGHNVGLRYPYVFPLSYDPASNKLILYIGNPPETILFDIQNYEVLKNAGNATLRKITQEESSLIQRIEVSENDRNATLTLPAGQTITPVIFTGSQEDLTNIKIKGTFSCDDASARVLYCGTNGRTGWIPYTMSSFSPFAGTSDRDGQRLEYLFVTRSGDVSSDATLELEFFKSDSDEVKTISVDASSLKAGGYSGVNPFDVFHVENLDADSLCGFVVGDTYVSDRFRNADGVINLQGNVFILDSASESVEFSLADLGIFETAEKVTLFNVEKKEYEKPLFDTTVDNPVYTFSDGVEVYIGWYDIDMADYGDYYLDSAKDVVLNGQYNNNYVNKASNYALLGLDDSGINDLTGKEFKIARSFIKFDDNTYDGESDGFAVGRVTLMNTARLENKLSAIGPKAIIIPPADYFRILETNVPADYWIPSGLYIPDNGYMLSGLSSQRWEDGKRIYLVPPVSKEVYLSNDLMHWKSGETGFDVDYDFELRPLNEEDNGRFVIMNVSDAEKTVTINLSEAVSQSQNMLDVYIDSTELTSLKSMKFSAPDCFSASIRVEATGENQIIRKNTSLSDGNTTINFKGEEADTRVYLIRFDNIWIDESAAPEELVLTVTFE